MDYRRVFLGEEEIDWMGGWIDYAKIEDMLTPTDIDADPLGMLSEYVVDQGMFWNGSKCVLVF